MKRVAKIFARQQLAKHNRDILLTTNFLKGHLVNGKFENCFHINAIACAILSAFSLQVTAQEYAAGKVNDVNQTVDLPIATTLYGVKLYPVKNENQLPRAPAGKGDAVIQAQKKQQSQIRVADANDVTNHRRDYSNIVIDQGSLRTAEVSDANPAGVGRDTPNKINTPSNTINGKALSNKDLPLGTESSNPNAQNINLEKIQVRAKRFYEIGPLPGLGLTKEQIPGNVQSISAKEIKDSHSLSITDLLNKKLQSVNVNDYQGNPFQMDVTYRGFTAGPQIGTPQGLSVFLDGIRVNEPFGDVVNWDMIPMNAIAGVDVFPGSNPIFGLNTLGGAFTLKTKDGFNNEGVDAEILTGSFGRKQLQAEGGINNGSFALFGAANIFLEDGWRDNSPSKVNQFFGKGSYRGDKLDLSLSTLLVKTDLVGNGLLPSEEYAQDRTSVFTSPDTTKNRLGQFQLSGNYFVNDQFTVTGQAYRRNSKRHAVGADVFTDYGQNAYARRSPEANEQFTCLFNSTNGLGVPDYVVRTIDNYDPNNSVDLFNDPFFTGGLTDLSLTEKNKALPAEFLASFKYIFENNRNFAESQVYNRDATTPPPNIGVSDAAYFGEATYVSDFVSFPAQAPFSFGASVLSGDINNYFFTTENGVIKKNYIFLLPAVNEANCQATQATRILAQGNGAYAILDTNAVVPDTVKTIDGFYTNGTGVVEGTPTAVFNDNKINQIVDGASLQFNWNLEHHKLMVGLSIDSANADYSNTSQLGFLDANRKAYLDPDQASDQFAGADIALANNDFSGTNVTKSIYFSETWTPVEDWNFNASARYNQTKTKNKVAARYGLATYGVGDLFALPDEYNICPNGDCTNVPVNYRLPRLDGSLNKAETEKFSYYSLNPSFGATWQVKENLNMYANWAQGTRTPSVIELGCALDKTLVDAGYNNPDGTPAKVYKSIIENRQCTLPTTLSGDPYLKQIKATTYDIGARGAFSNLLGTTNVQWNLGAYQTDLVDDIYFVNVGNGQGFFDNIGKTRRRGLEAGLSGKKDKLGFALNYGLTDATFQDSFTMISPDNSSSFVVDVFNNFNAIQVKPGNRMPGVPLHNLNANITYDITPKWQVGLTAIAHSESFVRGNENNEHKTGVTQFVQVLQQDGSFVAVAKQPSTNPGKLPGYATFNFQTQYQFNQEWLASMLVTNLFDKEFFSAGRLGRNPFSPSVLGAIGPDGYNHNSGDWRSTNFIAPSAPRGVWFSLNWRFDAKKK